MPWFRRGLGSDSKTDIVSGRVASLLFISVQVRRSAFRRSPCRVIRCACSTLPLFSSRHEARSHHHRERCRSKEREVAVGAVARQQGQRPGSGDFRTVRCDCRSFAGRKRMNS